MRRPLRCGLVVAAVALGSLLAACGDDSGSGGEALDDPELEQGRQVFSSSCAACHGAEGQGRSGPPLADGRVADAFPDVDDQVAVVENGRGGMPSFAGTLDESEIDAVVRYTREVL